MKKNKGIIPQNRTVQIVFVFLLIVASGFLCTSCKAEQSSQTSNQKFVSQKSLSQQPDYVIALEKGDYKSAIKEMRSLAEKGDPYAQYNLGLLYFRGSAGLPQNYKEAEKLWRKSAEQGLIKAQSGLAWMYGTGKGIDKKESFEWYRKAADHDSIYAKYNLAKMYQNGMGVSRNYQEALKLYHIVATKGFAHAQINLGAMYYEGIGVAKDYVLAYKWFYIATASSDKRLAGIARKAIELTLKHLNRKQIAEAIRLANEEKIMKIDAFEAFER